MSSFDPNFVSSIAGKIIDMIKDSDDDYFPKVNLDKLIINENVNLECFFIN